MSDKPADQKKFEDLTRDVDWQLNSLLSYIEKGFKDQSRSRAKMLPSEVVVQSVLDAYLHLARQFYDQFANQLKTAYEQKLADAASKDGVTDTEVSILMQKAVDKLTTEWARVYGFIAATEAKRTSETAKIINQLSPLIRAAIRDVGFAPEMFPVVPQFGTVYSLGFFNYTDDFMALNLPITALQSPWEWTIFWHEIAGQKVRLLKKALMEFQNVLREMFSEYRKHLQQYPMSPGEIRTNMNSDLETILYLLIPFQQMNVLVEQQKRASGFLDALTDAVYKDWENLDTSGFSLTNTMRFLQDLSPEKHDFPILMFSFNELLSDVMEELRTQQKKAVRTELRIAHREALAINRVRTDAEREQVMDELFNAWEKALSLDENLAIQKKALAEEGWSADWLEELFEDSFSVINFDFDFLPIFDRLLQRHSDGGKELRHPHHYVRLMAASALKLLAFDTSLLKQDLPPTLDELAVELGNEAKDILRKYYPGPLSADSQAVTWLVVKKFYEMHERMKIPQDDSENVIGDAKRAITDAMKTHNANTSTAESIAETANKVLSALSKIISKLAGTVQPEVDMTQNATRPQYETKVKALLNTRNIIPPQMPLGFRELLELSFYEVDFGTETYSNVRSPWGNFSLVTLLGPPVEVENGTVLFVDSRNRELKTNRSNWNDKAPTGSKL